MKRLFLLSLIFSANPLLAQQKAKELLAFSMLKANNPALSSDVSIKGGIESYNVITLPIGTNVSALKPTFTTSAGAKITVNAVAQTSSVSANDFAKPVVYRVTAEDGGTRDYTIEVSMQVNIPTLDDAVKAFMTKYDVPGLSIAILKNERLVYAKGYGVANKSTNEPVTPNSLFRVASVSKSITARAALKLVDEGKLNLDQKVFGANGILGTTYGSKPYTPQLEQITVRQLLNHTAGGDVWTNAWDPANNKLDPFYQKEWLGYTNEQVISAMLDTRPVTQTPGSKFVYSNIGINIAGRVIEKVSGVKYDKYVQDNLLKPIGIDPATMKIGGSTLADRFSNEVVYYNPYPGYDQPYDFPMSRFDAHGGWIMTAVNMARLLAFTDGTPAKKDILSANSVQEMYTTSAPSLAASPAFGYGLGCYIGTASKASTHDGGMAGTSATWWRHPTGYTYVVLANTRKSDASYYPDLELFLYTALFSGSPLAFTQLMKGDQFDTYYGQANVDQPAYCTPTQRDIYACASSDGTIGLEAFKVWSAGKTAVLLDSRGVCSQSGNAYSDLTGKTAAVKMTTGASYPFQAEAMRIQAGASKGSIYINPVSIWVDLDQNKVFTDDERVYYSSSTQQYPNPTLESQFVIPATAKAGQTRLRVRLGTAFTGLPETPCEQIDGETEDYLVDISSSCQVSTSLVTSNTTICQGGSTTLTASAVGGQGILTFTWQRDNVSLNETGSVLPVTIGGVYRFTANDASGCSGSSTVTVIANPLPMAAISGKSSFCTGQITNLSAIASTGTGPFTYQWKQGSNVLGTMNSYTASAVGTYSLVVTDKNGCVSLPVSVLVSEEPAPTLSLTGNNWFCTGRTTTLSGTVSGGTNPYTLQWQRNADLLATTTSLTVGTVGSYTLTAKDSRGCTVSSGISVSESTNPAPVIGGSASFCAGQASLLTATSNAGTGPFAINWQRDLNAVGTASPLSATAPGTYVTTITDAKGCVGTSAGFVVVQKDAPTALISVISGDLNLSPGGSVVLGTNNGTGLTYLWNKDGTPLTGVTSATYAANQAGVYTVIVSREGCTTTSVPTTVNLITATEPINAGLHLVVSPNPTDGPVQLQLYLAKPASATLHLTDILGRLVASWSFDKAVSEHKVRIDLPAGFYLLQAESDGGQVSQRLLVK